MMDMGQGILELFAEAQRGYGFKLDWEAEAAHRAIRALDFAKRRWAGQNKDKQREYNRRWRAKNPGMSSAPRTDADRAKRKARYAELRAAGLSRDEAKRRAG